MYRALHIKRKGVDHFSYIEKTKSENENPITKPSGKKWLEDTVERLRISLDQGVDSLLVTYHEHGSDVPYKIELFRVQAAMVEFIQVT